MHARIHAEAPTIVAAICIIKVTQFRGKVVRRNRNGVKFRGEASRRNNCQKSFRGVSFPRNPGAEILGCQWKLKSLTLGDRHLKGEALLMLAPGLVQVNC